MRELLDASYQGVKRLLVLACDNKGDNLILTKNIFFQE